MDGLIVRFNVATESQPLALVLAKVYVPLDVYAIPFQEYVSHSVTSVDDVVDGLIVKFKVAVESQPLEFVVE